MRCQYRSITRPLAAVLFAASLILPAANAVAQVNPVLTANAQGIKNDQTKEERSALHFASMRVAMRVHGRVADVTIDATIANRANELNEASFALTLPADAVVTGYALDIAGRMVDGQLIDQPKARNVYEDEVRGRIDPGLAEMAAANRFVTRVYPLPPGGSRSIRVSFVAPFDPSRGLVLPIETANAVGTFAVEADIQGYRQAPALTIGGERFELVRNGIGDGWQGSLAAKDKRVRGGVAVSGGAAAATMLVSRHRSGRSFFQIADVGTPAAPPADPGRLRVYWDRSLSRRDDLLAREIDLLARHVDAVRPVAVDLVSYASDRPVVTTLAGTGAAVRTVLGKQVYRGGTRLAGLDALQLPVADQCLMFTDGLPTVDPDAAFAPACRMSIVASAPDASGVRLGRLAQRSGGQLLRLDEANGDELLARLRKPVVTVVAARDELGRELDFRALPAADGGWFVVGEMPTSGEVRLTVAGLQNGLVQLSYQTGSGDTPGTADAPGALWAAQRTAELADDPRAHARMVTLAREFQVAGPTLAFLVLETPDQYLNAEIRPPLGYPEEWMTAYNQARRARDKGMSVRREQRFEWVLGQWNTRKQWWNGSFASRPQAKAEARQRRARRTVEGGEIVVTARSASPALQDVPMAVNAISADSLMSAEPAPVPASRAAPGTGAARPQASGKRVAIDLANVLSAQPYLAALDEAPPTERMRVLADQEARFGGLPGFYLDVSEWFRLKGDAATAEALLFSALELPVADDETRQIVAFRLQRAGQLDRAIARLERIAVTTDFRPQPKRALALALGERGRRRGAEGRTDLERAFALLTQVALEPAIQDFNGIELVALMEANALIPAMRAVGGSWSLDPRLVGVLHTDVRIVIEWTADATDLDLWVIEPSSEKVYYGDKQSTAGGLISDDMTAGYGPEEYMVRRAPAGEYRVRVHGFSPDRINPNGKGHVMVRLIRDFGRTTARETLVDAEIDFDRGHQYDDGEGGLLIAQMKVAPRSR